MWIQFLLIAAIVVLAAFMMRRTGADSHLAIRRILMGLFVVVAVLSVLFPQWLSWLAQLVGVGRGTDLVLYGLIVMFLAFVYTQYRRNAQQQRQLTRLSRKIALLEAEEHESREHPVEGDRP
ncbi:DUF2304 domain-containing protein [Microbacterium sp. NRRL B-14842]|uniref:DUF2304 domain-containing protein n=1 Tax=Microbacterium TaxID=33882 RepID=UPI0016569E12|nr:MULTISPECIES: DUF2304 domain-containing protein [Microbacterium]MCT1364485.1 DUF2304 domain-containing protein [Microbacterium sp. p3-SID131]MCT1376390.1 DUF2304 domain-containing protein [Microbacterium sp. p3-SID337]MCZ0709105.1 DUF2304 domain-containing protein [Microbacterium paraoxydans]CAD5138681.1 conserved membrane protein of unknown function [Microbacterium sp. Nx66]